ncbi:cytidine deaminase [Candidatus Bariatricus faecipullorum]
MTDEKTLIREALKMRRFSYSPYSHFRVGAALLDKQGNIHTGCNIENSAFSPSNCAERTAFFKAVSEGIREFEAIAIVGGPEGATELDYCAPCGVCRQVMREFCDDDFKIILARTEEEYKVFTLSELFPQSFFADLSGGEK